MAIQAPSNETLSALILQRANADDQLSIGNMLVDWFKWKGANEEEARQAVDEMYRDGRF